MKIGYQSPLYRNKIKLSFIGAVPTIEYMLPVTFSTWTRSKSIHRISISITIENMSSRTNSPVARPSLHSEERCYELSSNGLNDDNWLLMQAVEISST